MRLVSWGSLSFFLLNPLNPLALPFAFAVRWGLAEPCEALEGFFAGMAPSIPGIAVVEYGSVTERPVMVDNADRDVTSISTK